MTLDKKLIEQLINVTSNAAIACDNFIGKNDKIKADEAATQAMRKKLNNKTQSIRWNVLVSCAWLGRT